MLLWLVLFVLLTIVIMIVMQHKKHRKFRILLSNATTAACSITVAIFLFTATILSIVPIKPNGMMHTDSSVLAKQSNGYGGSVVKSTRVYTVLINGKQQDRTVAVDHVLTADSTAATSTDKYLGLTNTPSATEWVSTYSNQYVFIPLIFREKYVILTVPGGVLPK